MKFASIAAVISCFLLGSVASAQSARSLGMGNVGIAVANSGAAWAQNPAGLGALDIASQAGTTMTAEGDFTVWDASNFTECRFDVSTWDPAKRSGWGGLGQ